MPLLVAGADVNALLNPANEGVTALHLAAQRGHMEGVQLLLEAGASVNAYTTPLLDSRYKLDFASQLLLGTTSSTDKSDGRLRGFTALHLAAASASHEVVKVLIKAGAELDALTIGDTPYITAAQLVEVYDRQSSEPLKLPGCSFKRGLTGVALNSPITTLEEIYSRGRCMDEIGSDLE